MKYEVEVVSKIIGKERPRLNMITGHVYTPNKTKEYETLIQQEFIVKYKKIEQIETRVLIEIIAHIKIPKNAKKGDREKMLLDEISPIKKPDIDNIAKVVLDSLNKFIIKDDTQVSKIIIEKKYSETEKLEIKVEEY